MEGAEFSEWLRVQAQLGKERDRQMQRLRQAARPHRLDQRKRLRPNQRIDRCRRVTANAHSRHAPVAAALPEPPWLWLHGSWARGTASRRSDVELLVMGLQDRRLLEAYEVVLQALVASPQLLARHGDAPFWRSVRADAIPLLHSLGALAPDLADRLFIANGFAKGWAMTGWRVGWLRAARGSRRARS